MTRKHFVKIAEIIRWHPANKSAEIKSLTFDLADYFGSQNPNFDRAKFLDAAGVYTETES